MSELSILPKRSSNLSSEVPSKVAVGAADEEVVIIIVDAANGAIIDDDEVLPTLPYPYCTLRLSAEGGVLHALFIGISSMESEAIFPPLLLKLLEVKGS